jgi:voltage-gated potassium channel
MNRISVFGRDLGIIFDAAWINVFLFLMLIFIGASGLRFSGAYPKSQWLDLIVASVHLAEGEPVVEPGDGIVPSLLTLLLPIGSLLIIGEGAIRVFSIYSARRENREEWDRMVAKSFSNHIVICGVGELGRTLVNQLHRSQPEMRIVLVDLRPGSIEELGLERSNVVQIVSDMTNIDTLKKANCHKAKWVLVSSGNDALNLETAFKIAQLNGEAAIWVRLYRTKLTEILDVLQKPNIHFFSPYQSAAETLAAQI